MPKHRVTEEERSIWRAICHYCSVEQIAEISAAVLHAREIRGENTNVLRFNSQEKPS